MLKIMRRNTRIVIWCVVLSFAIWGGGSLVISSQVLSPYAGSAFGKKIKLREFEKRKRMMKFFMPAEFSALPDNVITAETFKQIALTRAAKKEGLKVTDEEVRLMIERIVGPGVWWNTGSYSQWTRQNLGENPRDFEETLRDALLAQKMTVRLFEKAKLLPLKDEKTMTDEEKKKAEAERNQILIDFYRTTDLKSFLKPEQTPQPSPN
jgi:hypothetical protein